MLEPALRGPVREVDLPGGEGYARGLTGHADNQGERELDPMRLRRLDPGNGQRIANDVEPRRRRDR